MLFCTKPTGFFSKSKCSIIYFLMPLNVNKKQLPRAKWAGFGV